MGKLDRHLVWGLWVLMLFVIALVLVLTFGKRRYGNVNEGRKPWEVYPLREEYAQYVQRTEIGLAILLGIAGCLLSIDLGLLISLIILFPIAHLTSVLLFYTLPEVCFPGDSYGAGFWFMSSCACIPLMLLVTRVCSRLVASKKSR